MTLTKNSFERAFGYFSLSSRIGAIKEAGLLEKWLTVYPDGDKCDKSLTHVGHKGSSLHHTSGALFAFTTGIVISFVVFLLEVTVYNIRNKIEDWSVSVIRLFEREIDNI